MSCTCLLHRGCCPIHGEFWEKEFEDEVYVTDMIHGTIMPYNSGGHSLSDLFEEYLGCDYKLEIEKGKRKVKVKCKKGCIQIERIGQ